MNRDTLFSIERAPVESVAGGPVTVMPIIRTPDGAVCGKVVTNHVGGADASVTKSIEQRRWQVIDAEDAVLCDIEEKVVGKGRATFSAGKYQYFDGDRTPIADFDGSWIEFEGEVAGDLRMLVIASPVAFDLLDGA